MDRYFIEGERVDRYWLFDRRRGQGDTYDETAHALAEIKDADLAQRICALLNADGLKPEKGTAK